MVHKNLTTDQAAIVLGLVPSSVARLCREGVIKADKFGRNWLIPRSDIHDVQRRQRGNPNWGKRPSK